MSFKLEYMSKEEKDAYGKFKMEQMRKKNEALMKRHEEVNQDKVKAEKENSSITAVCEVEEAAEENVFSNYSHNEWKAERAQIDKQRIARHKDNAGTFRREWDLGKDQIQLDLPPAHFDDSRSYRNDSRGDYRQGTREWDRGKYEIKNNSDNSRSLNENWRQRGGNEFRGSRRGSGSGGPSWRGNNRRPYNRGSSRDSGRFNRSSDSSDSFDNRSGIRYPERQRQHDRLLPKDVTNIRKEKISSGTWSDEDNTSPAQEIYSQVHANENVPVAARKVSSGTWSDDDDQPNVLQPGPSDHKTRDSSGGTWSDQEQPNDKTEYKPQMIKKSSSKIKNKKKHISSGTWSDSDDDQRICESSETHSNQDQATDKTECKTQDLATEVEQKKNVHISSGTWSDCDDKEQTPTVKMQQCARISSGTLSDEDNTCSNNDDSILKVTFNTSNTEDREVQFNDSKIPNENEGSQASASSETPKPVSMDLLKSVFGHSQAEYEVLATEYN